MSAMNEIVYKNCVPLDFENFLLMMFNNSFGLLQRLLNPPLDGSTINSKLENLDET